MKKVALLVFCAILLIGITGCDNKEPETKYQVYKFNFFDKYTPGATYSGTIDPNSGEASVTIDYSCSLPNPEDCGELHYEYSGKLSEEEVSKVFEILEKTNYADSKNLIHAVKNILQGDEICFEELSQTCVDAGNQTLDWLLNGGE